MNCLKWVLKLLFIVGVVGSVGACGKPGDSLVPDGDTYQDKTTDEDLWKKALQDGEYETAIELLDKEIIADPDNYFLNAYRGTAYLAKADITVLGIIKDLASGELDENAIAEKYVPADASDVQKSDVSNSVSDLEVVPESIRSSELSSYGQSVQSILKIATGIQTNMLLGAFTDASGEMDQSKLDDMTAAEAAALIDAMRSSQAALGDAAPADLQKKSRCFGNCRR